MGGDLAFGRFADSPPLSFLSDYFASRNIDLVVNIPKTFNREELTNDYQIRRLAVDFGVFLITNAENAKLFFESLAEYSIDSLEIKS
ncbi:MAG: hypothetical protein V1837_07385 [Candidatus Woesearchaeota archaeon]